MRGKGNRIDVPFARRRGGGESQRRVGRRRQAILAAGRLHCKQPSCVIGKKGSEKDQQRLNGGGREEMRGEKGKRI